MKNKFAGLFAVVAVAAAMASTASASELCTGVANAGVSDVTTIAAAGGCTVTGSNLLFNNFSVSPSAGYNTATVGISGSTFGTQVAGGDVDLAFQIGGISGPGAISDLGDVEMFYTVQGGISGIDITLQASQLSVGGFVQITEIACSVAFVGGACPGGDNLANYVVVSSGSTVTDSENFPGNVSVGTVYIKKDISFSGATTSEFVNSQMAVPEPMTFSLMGAGLLGLGLLGRRLRK